MCESYQSQIFIKSHKQITLHTAQSFHVKKVCSRLLLTEVQSNLQNYSPIGRLRATHMLHLKLVRILMVDFLLVTVELFLAALVAEGL